MIFSICFGQLFSLKYHYTQMSFSFMTEPPLPHLALIKDMCWSSPVYRWPLQWNVDSEAIDCHNHSPSFAFTLFHFCVHCLSSCLSALSLFSWFVLSCVCLHCLSSVCIVFAVALLYSFSVSALYRFCLCWHSFLSVYMGVPLCVCLYIVCLHIIFALSVVCIP